MGNDLQRRLLELGLADYAGTWSPVGPSLLFSVRDQRWGAKPGRPCIAVNDATGPLVIVRPRTSLCSTGPGFLEHEPHEACTDECIVTRKGWIATHVSLPTEKAWIREHISCVETDASVVEAVRCRR